MAAETQPVSPITDEELLRLADESNLRYERVGGELYAMAPTGGESGKRELRYGLRVATWAEKSEAEAFSASTGFRLPNADIRSPDVALLLPDHPAFGQKHEGFVPGAPDFLIEILSPTDSLTGLKEKMRAWIKAGTRLAWLVVPRERRVYVYRADGSVTESPYDRKLTGEDLLPGLELIPAELDPAD